MSKKLAIKGHPTRGKEVIELLEMMGGKNIHKLEGNTICVYYIIEGFEREIRIGDYIFDDEDICFFTLEEFLEKYPYKVGDKVHIYVQNDDIDGRYDIEAVEITSMRWNPTIRKIAYKMKNINREFYKEEIKCKVDDNPNNPIKDMEEKDKAKAPVLKGEDYSGKRFGYKIPDGYEFDVIVDGKIFLKPIKPKYPMTYEECCERVNACPTVGISYDSNEDMLYNDEVDLTLLALRKLLICRNAYWKIAGEQMGLDKPWEPDWTNKTTKYGIQVYQNKVIKDNFIRTNCAFVFPTPEIQDTFYENFKDLIEQCKELL